MTDYQGKYFRSVEQSKAIELFVCLFSTQQQISDSVSQLLKSNGHSLKCFNIAEDLEKFLFANNEQIDCLILAVSDRLSSVMNRLWQARVLLPVVVIETARLNPTMVGSEGSAIPFCDLATRNIYHRAELHLYPTQLAEINSYLNLAITRFISLTPSSPIGERFSSEDLPEGIQESLIAQQRRLTEKIKDKLGYLGIYYKRDLGAFYDNLSAEKQRQLEQKLSSSYRQIVIEYFNDNSRIDRLIDEFVDSAFFANISTSQVLEIHMKLIDDLSQQLKIEGRNEDILLDYRLPLIDVIAHLCEMYRRSIAEKDLSLELLFAVE